VLKNSYRPSHVYSFIFRTQSSFEVLLKWKIYNSYRGVLPSDNDEPAAKRGYLAKEYDFQGMKTL